MGVRHQRLEISSGPEMRIDLQVVGGVVLMVRWRQKDRVQVQSGDAELLEGIQPPANAGQVSPKEALPGRTGSPRSYRRGISLAIAVVKPVREDLIEDGILHPLGRTGGLDGSLRPGSLRAVHGLGGMQCYPLSIQVETERSRLTAV